MIFASRVISAAAGWGESIITASAASHITYHAAAGSISLILRGVAMSDSILRDKSKDFAKQIVFVCRKIKTEQHEAV